MPMWVLKSKFGISVLTLFALVPFLTCSAWAGQPMDPNAYESPVQPAPAWVKMVDLGERDPLLKGYRAPAGVKVEIVIAEPNVINPVGMRFGDDGTLYTIEWQIGRSVDGKDTTLTYKDGTKLPAHQWVKDVPDFLRAQHAANPDGPFDESAWVLKDLQLPSSMLIHDDWFYFSTRGGVTRRQKSKPEVQERIIQGLAGFNQHQASGLSLSPNGWLFVTNGDDDSHGEGSDGSRAYLLRNGAVWRARPDGSQLSLFARGFRNPYRDVVFDEFGNMFHSDNDNEDGSKFQGCRLIHIMEEADYGWRLKPSVRCCWPDVDRGAIVGERPGRMPPMAKTGRGAPAGLLHYQGTGFPAFFHDLLIYPDVFQRNVRAYRVARDGSTFKIVEQFELLTTTDGFFRPCQALTGPDGSIYLCDWRCNSAGPAAAWGDGKHGRIWRLSWEGSPQTPEAPAIPRARLDRWQQMSTATEPQLLALLENPDGDLRAHAVEALLKKGDASRAALLRIALDAKAGAEIRAAAFSGACRIWNPEVLAASLTLLKDANLELRRMAAETLSWNVPRADVTPAICEALSAALKDPHPAPRRAAALALGRLVSQLPAEHAWQNQAAKAIFDVLHSDDRADRFLHDGLLRGLERLGAPALDPLATAALSADPKEQAFAIGELECLRTREAVAVFDRVLKDAKGLGDENLGRLLTAYRFIQVEPAIDPKMLSGWLESHTDAPIALQVIALESLAMIGQMDAEKVMPSVLRLLQNPSAATRLAAVKMIGTQHFLAAAKPLVDGLKDVTHSLEERRAAIQALANLRGQRRFAQINFDPGVDGQVPALIALASDPDATQIRGDILGLITQIDFKQAQPLALKLLESPDLNDATAALTILSADPNSAKLAAQRFIDGKLNAGLLTPIAAALQRHIPKEGNAELAALRTQVLSRGLTLSASPEDIKRIRGRLEAGGNALRGRAVFLNKAKSTCMNCHRLEGVGGQVGPDLTKLYQNVTLEKLVESILEPSKEIKEGFETYTIKTTGGQILTGIKVSADGNMVVLRDTTGKSIVVAAGNITKMAASKQSLMPDGVAALLSQDEFIDLLAFLLDGKAQATLRNMATELNAAGPFAETLEDHGAEAAADPLEPIASAGGPRNWRRMECNADGVFDLAPTLGGGQSGVYAMLFVQSPAAKEVQFSVNCGGEIKFLLNGEGVFKGAPQAAIKATLKAGWNRITIGVHGKQGAIPFGLAIVDGDGSLRLSAKPEN